MIYRLLCGLFAVLASPDLVPVAYAAEEPAHTVVTSDGAFEIRDYAAYLVAEVQVDGSMGKASNQAFWPLFRFISGDNMDSQSIDMTAPVTRQAGSVKIDMTAPVTRTSEAEGWTVAFIMPSKWTLDTLPVPTDPKVSIRSVPAERVATIRFSGSGRETTHRKKQTLLEAWLTEQGYTATGPARYAGYDRPGIPGPFRRNEVMIPVALAES